ncbi:hypothetical protein ACI2JA_00795 [Alkalihalobacillus sp. NPDC078783]
MRKWYTILWIPLVLLFISGFFFLDKDTEIGHSVPGEQPTVTVNEEDIMAIRLSHEATRFKVKQLEQVNLTETQMEQELQPYMEEKMIKQLKQWVQGLEVAAVDALITTDTSKSPIIEDEYQEGEVTVTWEPNKTSRYDFTYSKPGDQWLLENISKGVR